MTGLLGRLHRRKEQLKAQLAQLDSMRGKRLKILQQTAHNGTSIEAMVRWVRSHRQAFHKDVYEPVCLEVITHSSTFGDDMKPD